MPRMAQAARTSARTGRASSLSVISSVRPAHSLSVPATPPRGDRAWRARLPPCPERLDDVIERTNVALDCRGQSASCGAPP
jgi:hypothetical protein